MRIFRRDPAKKQINALAKSLSRYKEKRVLKHLLEQDTNVDIWEIFDKPHSPEDLAPVVKVYAVALQPGNEGRRKIAIETLVKNADSDYRLEFLKPHENIINTPLLDCLSDEELSSEYRIKCASILARLGNQDAVDPIRSLLLDETLEIENRIRCASILAQLGDQGSIEPIRLLLLDETVEPAHRIECASILAQLGGQGSIEPIRSLLLDETLEPAHRIECASILAQLGDQGSIEPIRSLLKLEAIDLRNSRTLLQACHQLGIPEGKSLAYKAINTYRKYKDKMNIGNAERAFEVAVPYLVAHLDDETIDYLESLVSEFTERLKAMKTFTIYQVEVPGHGLNTTVKALATCDNPKAIELLIRFIKGAAPLSSRRQVGSKVEQLLNIGFIHGGASAVIKIWQESNNAQALTLLNNELGEEQVKALSPKT